MQEIELIDKRKEREKHFLQANGEIIAKVYDEDIHFLKNGKYEEIDNTLVKQNEYYTNKRNAYKIKFSTSEKKDLMKMETQGHYLNIKLKNNDCFNVDKEKRESKICDNIHYNNILENIDLDYKVMSNKVKECVILKTNKANPDDLIFIVDTDLTLEVQSDRSISAKKDNEVIFHIASPFMVDANNQENNNVEYKLLKKEDQYILKLVVDKDWLNEETRVYPITIDPTITNYGQNNNVYDTYIYPGDTNVDRNSLAYLKIGVEKVNGNNVVNRALLKFDLPTIGTGSQIIEAILTLDGYPDFTHKHKATLLNVHRITKDWTETGANWNTMNNKYDSRVEGVFESTRRYYEDESGMSLFGSRTDLTSLVKKWYEDTPNYGIMIKANKEVYTSETVPMFFSKNNTVTGGNPKPILSVTYRNQNGIESYMDYKMQSFEQGNAYHNSYNGNLTTIFDIGATIEGKLPSSLKLIYNTNDVVLNNNLGYGLGFRLNLSQTIKEVTIDNVKYLEYVDEDGTIHYFLNQKSKFDDLNSVVTTTYENTYFDEDGLNLMIEKSDTNYVLKDKNNNQMKFNKINDIGYLVEIKDVSGNINTVIYDSNNKITKVVDANNQEINIAYETNKMTVTSPDQTVIINYENNNLISIESFKGITSFNNQNNLITSITDVNGRKIAYEYYEQIPYRVKKVLEYGLNNVLGNTYEVTYGFNITSIKDSKERIQTIAFNNYGNVSSISSLKSENDITSAYGISQENGEVFQGVTMYKNKLLGSQIPLQYVKNYLTNTSFEQGNSFSTEDRHIFLEQSTEETNSGFKSLKMECLRGGGERANCIVDVPKGQYYTFSAYFKTDYLPLRIALSYYDENNNLVESISEPILSENEFNRFDVSIYYPESALTSLKISIIFDYIGDYYMDDVQLEKGEVANNYNMLENSDFSEGLSSWILSAKDWTNESDNNSISTDGIFEVVDITEKQKALKVNMKPENTTEFSQEFNVSGKAGDTYTLALWFKHMGMLGLELSGTMGRVPLNNIILTFIPVEEQPTDLILNKAFNSNETTWQYFSNTFTALWDFKKIKLTFIQSMNANDFYITNLSLFKDVRSVTYDYDENGNIILSKDLNNQTNEFKYDKNNQLTKMMDPKGKNLMFEYDNIITDRVLKGVSETGISNEIKYDPFGNPIVTKITNHGQVFVMNEGTYRIRMKGNDNSLRIIDNELKVVNDTCGHDMWLLEKTTIDEIDYFKIKHAIINKYLNVVNNNLELSSTDNSLFKFIKQENGSFIIRLKSDDSIIKDDIKYLKYNNNSLVLEVLEDNDENFEFYLESKVADLFIENSAEYTEDGKFIKSTTDTNFNKTIYDIDTTTGLVQKVINAKGQETSYNYNNKRQLTSIIDKDKTVTYEYNDQNSLSKIIQGSRTYNFEYDNFLNMKSIKIGDNITLITNNYEERNGNLLSSTYGNNDTISYKYDEFDRIKTLTKMNDIYHYKYGNNGDLMKIISNNDLTKYTYDLGKRLYEYQFNQFKIRYGYDSNDNIISKNYNLDEINHSVINTLNEDDSIIKTTLDGIEINYNYDSLGRLESSNINNNYPISYKYVTNGKRTSMLVESISNNGDKYLYKYDELNNITHIYHNNILENEYYYDDYNELIKEDNYLLNQTIKYQYDNLGNMLFKKVYELNTDNLLNQNTYEYNNINWKDQLTKFNNDNITYDEIGNPLTIGDNIHLSWINGRQLDSYMDLNNNINYKYNKDGIRISKKINNIETKYYVEGTDIIVEKTGDNVLYFIHNDIDGLVGFKYNEDLYYYVKNNQDDIIGILDNNYNTIAKYSYDSWGNIISITDVNGTDVSSNNEHIANINPFRYRSYYYDKETKLYYLNSRYYNPMWGRFINADNVICSNQDILSYNLYAYCSNNPVNLTDPSGEGLFKSIAKAVKKIVKKAKQIVSKVINKTVKTVGNLLSKVVSVEKRVTTNNGKPAYTGIKNVVSYKTGSSSSVKETIFGNDDSLFKVTINYNTKIADSSINFSTNSSYFNISKEFGLFSQKSSKSITVGNGTITMEGGFENINLFFGFDIELNNGNNTLNNYYGNLNMNIFIPVRVVAGVPDVSLPKFDPIRTPVTAGSY